MTKKELRHTVLLTLLMACLLYTISLMCAKQIPTAHGILFLITFAGALCAEWSKIRKMIKVDKDKHDYITKYLKPALINADAPDRIVDVTVEVYQDYECVILHYSRGGITRIGITGDSKIQILKDVSDKISAF